MKIFKKIDLILEFLLYLIYASTNIPRGIKKKCHNKFDFLLYNEQIKELRKYNEL